ncbi:MAG TPA: ATP-grasp domain-containing protein [Acetobacteraceae bacterium]|nr:ATP-grasp domain-containing protein [Acetobacteraceae bacterium]
MLIAALSGRALAAAAHRSGFRPLVADFFGDLDTVALSAAVERVSGSLARGLRRPALLATLDRLAAGRAPVGVVCGSGFEDRPALLAAIGRRHRLLGNRPDTMQAVKRPEMLAALCARVEVSHPDIGDGAAPGTGWLEKRAGGSGGVHVRPLAAGDRPRRGRYAQRRAAGRAVSALVLADGAGCGRVLGFSEQWSAPTPGRPHRYGGAARPAVLPPAIAPALAAAALRLASAAGLVGLNALDFMVRPDGFDLIEINPRPGATLDVFAHPLLFAAHVAACDGTLPAKPPVFAAAAAAAIVYAPHPLAVPAGFAWPDWTADREAPGSRLPARAPLCTVLADAPDTAAARTLVGARSTAILAAMEACHG